MDVFLRNKYAKYENGTFQTVKIDRSGKLLPIFQFAWKQNKFRAKHIVLVARLKQIETLPSFEECLTLKWICLY